MSAKLPPITRVIETLGKSTDSFNRRLADVLDELGAQCKAEVVGYTSSKVTVSFPVDDRTWDLACDIICDMEAEDIIDLVHRYDSAGNSIYEAVATINE